MDLFDIAVARKLSGGGGGGGGGDSDFSTAQVTVTNNQTANLTLHIPNADDLEGTPFSPASLGDIYVESGQTITTTAILYKGKSMLSAIPSATVSGNIETVYGQWVISGDCTITIS